MTIKQLTAREWRLYIVALLATIYVVTWRVLARPRSAAETEAAIPLTGTVEASRVTARPQLVRAPQPHVAPSQRPQLVRTPQPHVAPSPRSQVARPPQPEAAPSPRSHVVAPQPHVNRTPPRVVRVPARRIRTRSS